ncbi:hypothetical protein JOB18_032260 [Solea senegalensis]|uniref:Secreted protein n=1 Tax=Solea senegalensis TaxID=28829 RepID=A0AAV6Q3F1_SOLSE|nr:hypothetical protein JOB18_032260 [Solea senegalensis]
MTGRVRDCRRLLRLLLLRLSPPSPLYVGAVSAHPLGGKTVHQSSADSPGPAGSAAPATAAHDAAEEAASAAARLSVRPRRREGSSTHGRGPGRRRLCSGRRRTSSQVPLSGQGLPSEGQTRIHRLPRLPQCCGLFRSRAGQRVSCERIQ